MGLTAGTRLGPYEIVSLLGAGGMGEVYRARDPRLGRDVAIKVLPQDVTTDAERLARFEREARAVAALSHANILGIFDIGADDGVTFAVTELLEGQTLRDRLMSGAIPVRAAVDIAIQIARGLSAAHSRGLVHRDLKPENVFLLPDGHVKILDFGLALQMPGPGSGDTETVPALTEPGTVMGTMGYMAPEQVRGLVVDARADLFALGALMYEVLSGRRAFAAPTAADTITAILQSDPPDIASVRPDVPPAVDQIVRRCLEKNPAQRFQTAQDLTFALEQSLASRSSPVNASAVATMPAPLVRATRMRRAAGIAIVLVAAGLGAIGGLLWGSSTPSSPAPTYKRLAFRRGAIGSARFAPDGQTIVYSAAWQSERAELFSARTNGAEARSLGLPGTAVLSISSTGEMALRMPGGILARAPLAGGAPREVLAGVTVASWNPGGTALAVVRSERGRQRLEFPAGTLLYEVAGALANLAVSPHGDLVASSEALPGIGSLLSVVVIDPSGKRRVLSEGWLAIRGLGWSPDGREIWFAASRSVVGGRSLFAVTLDGTLREMTRLPVNLTLHDISRDGQLLLERSDERLEADGLLAGDTGVRSLSSFDYNGLSALSPDGRTLILTEHGEGGFHVSLRRSDESSIVRLGDGGAFALSPDGRSVIHLTLEPQQRLGLLPTGPGDLKLIDHQPFRSFVWASWFPDGRRILFAGSEPGKGNRLYVQEIAGGPAHPITAEGVTIMTGTDTVSPDGLWVAALGPFRLAALYPVAGGDPKPLKGAESGDLPTRWSADGKVLYLFRQGVLPAPVYRLTVATGLKTLWKEVGPSDVAGVRAIGHFLVTPDGTSYAYNYQRTLSDLYLVKGVK